MNIPRIAENVVWGGDIGGSRKGSPSPLPFPVEDVLLTAAIGSTIPNPN
jgi:hypothetical protein